MIFLTLFKNVSLFELNFLIFLLTDKKDYFFFIFIKLLYFFFIFGIYYIFCELFYGILILIVDFYSIFTIFIGISSKDSFNDSCELFLLSYFYNIFY